MSIAYGFDPDISPIREDEDDEPHSVHFSSADTPKRYGTQQTLGASRLYEDPTEEFHNFHQECVENCQTEGGEDEEGEDVENSEDVVVDSHERNEDVGNLETDEIVPDSTGVLGETWIVLSAGCCLNIQHHLAKLLKEMGATTQQSVDHRTTHLVVDRYADEQLVREAMLREPFPPLMVDVKWIQECQDQRQRCEETDFSMRGARYLRRTCKRLSSFREMTPEGNGGEEEETRWWDMENTEPDDPAELLKQIKELSERLDALLNYAPIIRFEYHSPDCPTRLRIPAPRPAHLDSEKFRSLLTSISTSSTIRRRRSFTGFHLEHRKIDDRDDEILKIRENWKDERKTWSPPKKTAKIVTISGEKSEKPEKSVKSQKKSKKTPKKPVEIQKKSGKKPIPVNLNDSDINCALASLTISSATSSTEKILENSVEILEESTRRRAPLVVTKSAFINRLQVFDGPQASGRKMANNEENDDDDFISDVSAFRQKIQNQKTSGRSRRIAVERNFEERLEVEVEEIERRRDGVVFTGFGKNCPIEKKLKSILRRFKLHVSTEIDESTTKCVVSRHGKRTLMVLKALCMDVPVVKPQWLEESFEDSLLLPHEDYLYTEWTRIPGANSLIFSNFPEKIWISSDCEVPKREDLCWLVEKCGGKISRKLRHATLIIGPENWKIPEKIAENLDKFAICSHLFIIDSVAAAELLEPQGYFLST